MRRQRHASAPKQQPTPKLTPVDLQFFRDKVNKIRVCTAAVPPPVIADRRVPPMSSFVPESQREIVVLLHNTPSKSCAALDHIPTWLLKRLSACIAPVICYQCNLSIRSGIFPPQLKQARVLPLPKKNHRGSRHVQFISPYF